MRTRFTRRTLLAGLATAAASGRVSPTLGAEPTPRGASGYVVKKLPLPPDILPSCMAVRPDGTLVVGSMDGDVLLVVDGDGDGVPDRYRRWAGTLSHWPLGMRAEGDALIVATRSALLRLTDRDRDGWAERWETLCDEWDVTKDHHDWTTGVAPWPGPEGGWVVSPVTDDVRERSVKGRHHLRGKAIRVAPDGKTTVLAEGLRYPTGWAARPSDGAVFFTDNQGQQKTTCEIDRLVVGGWYGYPSQADAPSGPGAPRVEPSVRIPYPWARSVNGLDFASTGGRFGPLEGQIVLCEYNNRFILRASLEDAGGATQGACYPFLENLLGPITLAFSPDGSLYVGSLREPAWGGEPEQGAVYRVQYSGRPVFGIRTLRATPDGFLVDLLARPERPEALTDPSSYRIRRYRHVFAGAYHSPPVDDEALRVATARVEGDDLTVRLTLREPHLEGRIYEVRTTLPGAEPPVGHYTMNRVPSRA
ncbi:MAG: sugar dehydrogenase [Isosphaeraceae bacterium]